jgi:hypothetical protein
MQCTLNDATQMNKTKHISEYGQNCLFQGSLLIKALETRHNCKPHLAMATRNDLQSICTQKIVEASSSQCKTRKMRAKKMLPGDADKLSNSVGWLRFDNK